MESTMRRSKRRRRFGRKYGLAIFLTFLVVGILALVGVIIMVLNQPNRYFGSN